jgi:hypothetical protein
MDLPCVDICLHGRRNESSVSRSLNACLTDDWLRGIKLVNNDLCFVFSETQQMVECDYDTSQTIAQQNTGKSFNH